MSDRKLQYFKKENHLHVWHHFWRRSTFWKGLILWENLSGVFKCERSKGYLAKWMIILSSRVEELLLIQSISTSSHKYLLSLIYKPREFSKRMGSMPSSTIILWSMIWHRIYNKHHNFGFSSTTTSLIIIYEIQTNQWDHVGHCWPWNSLRNHWNLNYMVCKISSNVVRLAIARKKKYNRQSWKWWSINNKTRQSMKTNSKIEQVKNQMPLKMSFLTIKEIG